MVKIVLRAKQHFILELKMNRMKYKIYILVILGVVLNFTSCYNYRSVGLMQENNSKLPKYDKIEYADYRIKVNDEIIYRLMTSDETISKLINPENSLTQSGISYRVYSDGTIDLPFIKKIKLVDLTIAEATSVVEARFKELIPDAAVKLTLSNKTFTVIGEVGTGVFEIPRDKLTIFQALSLSGELNLEGDFKKVKILRETSKGTEVLEFDIRPKSIIESKYYYIYPNDIIYVQRAASSFYKVSNWSNFASLIASSLTLLFTVFYLNK